MDRLAQQDGLLGAEHPLMRLLALRVSTHYLPGVSEFPLPPPPQQPQQQPSPSDRVDASKNEEAAAAVPASIPRSPSDAGGGGGNNAWGFIFQPLPRGAQLLCTVTRAGRSRLRPPVYRLHVERLCLAGGGDEGTERQLRRALQAAGLDARWVVGPGGAEEEAVGAQQREDGSRCLLEARRLKASPMGGKAAQELVVYGFVPASSGATADSAAQGGGGSNGKKGKNGKRGARGGIGRGKGKGGEEEGEKRVAVVLGRLQSPAPGVLTAAATGDGAVEDDPSGSPASSSSSSLGARLCVHVSERERLLSLSAVLPAETGRGNVYTSARGVPEVLEAPLAHLQAALSLAKGAASQPPSQQAQQAFFGARSRPPRYSPLDRLYTLDFERGPQRVREPSRKNVALMDVSHLPASALVAPPPAVARGGSGAGGGGDGGSVGALGRGWSRAGRGAAGQEVGWARGEGKGPKPVLQLGKMGDLRFSLDFRAPFSPFQALAVAIAAFEA